MSKLGRREFMGASAAGLATAAAIRSAKARTVAPSDRLGAGFIGLGRQGTFNMRKFLEYPDFRAVAVCDVYEPHLQRAKEETGAEAYRDFRQVLDRKDIDVVMIASPDHWHAAMTIMACDAGKDVYVEKPICVAVAEGRAMVEAARRNQRVVQVGTQQRSGLHFQEAVQLIRRGDLGKITAVRCWNFNNSTPDGIGNIPDSDPPADLDWDMWLGPAPKVPFNANKFGVFPDRWSSFRWFWDYAGGMMTDWGVHHLDIIQWAMNVEAPVAVSASGGKLGLHDDRETPDTLTATFEYPGFLCTYEYRECNSSRINEHGYGIEFYGSEGTLFLDRSGFRVTPQTFRRDDKDVARMYAMQYPDTNDDNHDHVGNLLECIRSRKRPISDIEIGHRSSSTCFLGNISVRTGHKVRWDAADESIPDDAEAASYLKREYRAPWKL